MGQIASQFASFIIITDDNPRDEDPSLIRKDILLGISKNTQVEEIADRKMAIHKAIKLAQKDCIVVIAGKGHENYQIYKQVRNTFSDELEAKKILGEL